MPYINPETIKKAKQIDLLTYLQTYEPDELVKVSENVYCTRTHDSLKISNGMWKWWSRDIGGRSALDYLIKINGLSFTEAVEKIMDTDTVLPLTQSVIKPKSAKKLLLPLPNSSNNIVIKYLTEVRKIDAEIVNYCIDKGYIYESLEYNNTVFVGFNEQGQAKYAGFRACKSERIMGDCSGSDKAYSFRLVNEKCTSVHIFECPIDLLSCATLLKLKGNNWRRYNLLSLSGVYQPKKKIEESKVPVALQTYLRINPQIDTAYLHLDNDFAGRVATKAIKILLDKDIKVIDNPVPKGKDVNDFLILKCKNRSRKINDIER